MPSVIAFGRINGAPQFQYGPETFDKDWSRMFKALSFADFAEKFAVQYSHALETSSEIAANFITEPPSSDGLSEMAQRLTLEKMVGALEQLLMDLDYLQITSETTQLLRENRVNARTIRFASLGGRAPAELVAEVLSDMGLVEWGYPHQIVRALLRFQDRSGSGDRNHRSMSVFFKN